MKEYNVSSSFLSVGKVVSPDDESVNEVSIGGVLIGESYRIVYIDNNMEVLYLINLDSVAKFPICASLKETRKLIDKGDLFLSDYKNDPRLNVEDEFLSDGFKEKAARRLKDILPLTLDVESVLKNVYGDKVFKKVAADVNRSEDYIRNTFFSYLKHLGVKNCLGLPQGKDAFNKPKAREIHVKQGAPNRGVAKGKVLNERDYQAFNYGKNYFKNNGYPSIKKVYRRIKNKFYVKSRAKLSPYESFHRGENYEIEHFPPNEMPTENQFLYWLKKSLGVNYQK